MCKVIEKFAVKIFLEETYIITGNDPEIYREFVVCIRDGKTAPYNLYG